MWFAQGKVLGGGGSINAQVFTRGARKDYDEWADEDGCAGWSFAEVLPYFLRFEDNERFSTPGTAPAARSACPTRSVLIR